MEPTVKLERSRLPAARALRQLARRLIPLALALASVVWSLLLVTEPALADPTVKITSPAEGAVITGTDVTVTIDVGDLKLVPGAQATQKSDLHVHYLLDVDPTPYLDGKRDIPTGDPNIIHSASTSHTFSNLSPGHHRVTVILTNADHIAIQPPVAPSVSFTIVDPLASQLPKSGGAPESAFIAGGLLGLALAGGGVALRRLAPALGLTRGDH